MREKAFIPRLIWKLRALAARLTRRGVVRKMRERNLVKACSIISSNCIGCLVSHDLGLRFDSPTVNLFFTAEDFIRFAENLAEFLTVPLTNVHMDEVRGFPVGNLAGITLNFAHYKTCAECVDKWESRKKRVDWNNMFFIFTDRDGMTADILRQCLRLPYRKVIFVSRKEWLLSPECVYVPGFEENGQVGELDKYADFRGDRYYEKYFDIVGFLNGKR